MFCILGIEMTKEKYVRVSKMKSATGMAHVILRMTTGRDKNSFKHYEPHTRNSNNALASAPHLLGATF